MLPDRKRLENLRFYLNLNKTAFAKVLGYTTPQSYTSYLSGNNNLSMRMVKAIKKHDSNINLNWILDGQGEMLLSSPSKSKDEENKDIKIQLLEKEIEYLNEKLKDKEDRIKDKDKLITILEKNQR